MRLILSSRDFGGEASHRVILRQLPKPPQTCQTLFIPNEKTTHERIAGGLYHARLQKYGFDPALVTVFDETVDEDYYASLPLDLIYITATATHSRRWTSCEKAALTHHRESCPARRYLCRRQRRRAYRVDGHCLCARGR